MASIERSIDVRVPVSVAYNTWTQFELFPRFMAGVKAVEQKDDRHLYWRARVFGKSEEWDAEITEQIKDKRIAWRSEAGAVNAGVVVFRRINADRSRVILHLDYEPKLLSEKIGSALGLLTRRIEGDLRRFKLFAELKGERIRGWRGEIRPHADVAQGNR